MRLANTYGLTGMVSLNGTVTRPQLESLVSAASAVAQQCLPGSSGPALYMRSPHGARLAQYPVYLAGVREHLPLGPLFR